MHRKQTILRETDGARQLVKSSAGEYRIKIFVNYSRTGGRKPNQWGERPNLLVVGIRITKPRRGKGKPRSDVRKAKALKIICWS